MDNLALQLVVQMLFQMLVELPVQLPALVPVQLPLMFSVQLPVRLSELACLDRNQLGKRLRSCVGVAAGICRT